MIPLGIGWPAVVWSSLGWEGAVVVRLEKDFLSRIAENLDDLKVRKRDGETKDDKHTGTADEFGRGCGEAG